LSNLDSNTTSGRRVILFVFGGIALFIVVGLSGFLFLTPKSEPCANGALAKNPETQPGLSLPRQDTLDNLNEAEKFICHTIPVPRDSSLALQQIVGYRQSSLQDVVEGNALAEIRFTYLHKPSGQTLQVNAAPYDLGPPAKTPESETIRINGQEGLETHGGPTPDYVVVDWIQGGLAYHAQTLLTGGMTQDTLLALLNSIR